MTRKARKWAAIGAVAGGLVLALCLWAGLKLGRYSTSHYSKADETATRQMAVSGEGAGPVRLGMKKEDMLAALGKPDVEDQGTYKYFGKGLEVFVTKGAVKAIMLHARTPDSERRGFNNYEEFGGATAEGIKIGSARADVKAKLGEPAKSRKLGDEEQAVYAKPPMTFAYGGDGKVLSLALHGEAKE